MRGTLHILTSRDLGLWLSGLPTYRDAYTHYGMRDPVLLELAGLIGRALQGRLLTRSELADAVADIGGSSAAGAGIADSWGSSLKPASFLGQLCFAPSRGPQVRFTHPATWLTAAPSLHPSQEVLGTRSSRSGPLPHRIDSR